AATPALSAPSCWPRCADRFWLPVDRDTSSHPPPIPLVLLAVQLAQQRCPQPRDRFEIAPLVLAHAVERQRQDFYAVAGADFVSGDRLSAHCNANGISTLLAAQPLALR